jgi:hypothetical protein
MAHIGLANAIDSRLDLDIAQVERMNQVARAIRGTLMRTRGALLSLADLEGNRYRVRRTAWDANANTIRRISAVDLTTLEKTYSDLERSRANYNVMMSYDIRYVDSLDDF